MGTNRIARRHAALNKFTNRRGRNPSKIPTWLAFEGWAWRATEAWSCLDSCWDSTTKTMPTDDTRDFRNVRDQTKRGVSRLPARLRTRLAIVVGRRQLPQPLRPAGMHSSVWHWMVHSAGSLAIALSQQRRRLQNFLRSCSPKSARQSRFDRIQFISIHRSIDHAMVWFGIDSY